MLLVKWFQSEGMSLSKRKWYSREKSPNSPPFEQQRTQISTQFYKPTNTQNIPLDPFPDRPPPGISANKPARRDKPQTHLHSDKDGRRTNLRSGRTPKTERPRPPRHHHPLRITEGAHTNWIWFYRNSFALFHRSTHSTLPESAEMTMNRTHNALSTS